MNIHQTKQVKESLRSLVGYQKQMIGEHILSILDRKCTRQFNREIGEKIIAKCVKDENEQINIDNFIKEYIQMLDTVILGQEINKQKLEQLKNTKNDNKVDIFGNTHTSEYLIFIDQIQMTLQKNKINSNDLFTLEFLMENDIEQSPQTRLATSLPSKLQNQNIVFNERFIIDSPKFRILLKQSEQNIAYIDIFNKIGKLNEKLTPFNDLYQSSQQANLYIISGFIQERNQFSKTEIKDQLALLVKTQQQLDQSRLNLEEPLNLKEEFVENKTANFQSQVNFEQEKTCFSQFWQHLDVSQYEYEGYKVLNDKLQISYNTHKLFMIFQIGWNFSQISFNLIFYLLFLSQLLTGNVKRLEMRQFLFLNIILILINIHQLILIHIQGAKIVLYFMIIVFQGAITMFIWGESINMRLKYKDLFQNTQ